MRQHEPGRIHTWTFDQTELWVDKNGVEHRIDEISREYALNIIMFLLRSPEQYRLAYYLQNPHKQDEFGDCFNAPPRGLIESRPIIAALRKRVLREDAGVTIINNVFV